MIYHRNSIRTVTKTIGSGRLLVVFIFLCNLVAVIIYIMDTTSG